MKPIFAISSLILLLIFSLGFKNAPPKTKQLQCQGVLEQNAKRIGNYSLKLKFRMPRGGDDRRAGGEGVLTLRTSNNQSAVPLRLNCQMQIDLPGGLICLTSGSKNPIGQSVFVEIHPAQKSQPERLKFFLGPWNSKAASLVYKGAGCN